MLPSESVDTEEIRNNVKKKKLSLKQLSLNNTEKPQNNKIKQAGYKHL